MTAAFWLSAVSGGGEKKSEAKDNLKGEPVGLPVRSDVERASEDSRCLVRALGRDGQPEGKDQACFRY